MARGIAPGPQSCSSPRDTYDLRMARRPQRDAEREQRIEMEIVVEFQYYEGSGHYGMALLPGNQASMVFRAGCGA